jgi:hypothetical protein
MGLFGDLIAAVVNRVRQLRLLLSRSPDADETQPQGDAENEKREGEEEGS